MTTTALRVRGPRRRARRRVRPRRPAGSIDGRRDRRVRRVSYPGTTGRVRLVQALFDALDG